MLTKKKQNAIKFTILIALVIFIIFLVKMLGIKAFLSPDYLREQINQFGALAPIIFIIVYSISTIFFLPGTPITLAGGVIFGKFLGTI